MSPFKRQNEVQAAVQAGLFMHADFKGWAWDTFTSSIWGEKKERSTHFNSKMFNILGLFIFLNFTFTYPYPLVPKSDHKNGGYDGESTGIRMHVLFFSPICS